jgi:hypothetical protein
LWGKLRWDAALYWKIYSWMKNLRTYRQLFESLSNKEDLITFYKIKALSGESWFIEGDDPPEEVVDEFSDVHTDDSDLDTLIEFTTEGPGTTDVWINRGVLIADVIAYGDGLSSPDEEVTEDDIEEENRESFSEMRKESLMDIERNLDPRSLEMVWTSLSDNTKAALYSPNLKWIDPEERKKLELIRSYQGFKGML